MDSRKKKIVLAAAAVILLIGALLWARGDAGEPPPPEIVFSPAPDTVALHPQPDAVGLCALSRTTGALEGRIVGITPAAGEAPPRYEVEAMDGTGRRVHLRAEGVMLDLCERAVQAAPAAEPIRVQPGSR